MDAFAVGRLLVLFGPWGSQSASRRSGWRENVPFQLRDFRRIGVVKRSGVIAGSGGVDGVGAGGGEVAARSRGRRSGTVRRSSPVSTAPTPLRLTLML